MKDLSLFSGIGAFEKALDNLEIPYELVAYCEIDKYASKSYAAIHGVDESKNLGDITKVDEKKLPQDIDLITYGFPCQDISLAGKQKGLFNEDGTQTRSGLFFEALRIIEETQPRVAIAENVKNLTSKKFALQFKIVLDSLKAAGYNNYFKVLNAKDYGIPQNRERVFIVSIRKDIDNGSFKFPVGFPLHLRLKDMLEDVVDEKFYLSKGEMDYMNRDSLGNYSSRWTYANHTEAEKSVCLTANICRGVPYNILIEDEPSVRQIGNCCPTKTRDNPNQGRVYDVEGLSPCLNQMGGGNRQPFVVEDGTVVKVREATKKGYAEAEEGDSINLEQPNSKTKRGRVGHGVAQTITTSPQQAVIVEDFYKSRENKKITAAAMRGRYDENGTLQQHIEVSDREYANALTTVQKDSMAALHSNLRIRKLTPKECFRLMGFDDESFFKAEAVNSNTQLYKQAGNSIVVPVVEHIISALVDCGALEGTGHG